MNRSTPSVLALLCAGCLSACAATEPPPEAAPEVVAAAEAGMLAPFESAWALGADRVVVELSPNFFDDRLALPALDKELHAKDVVREANVTEFRYTNRSGGTQRPLFFSIGKAEFVVLEQLEVRVLTAPQQPLVMRVTASGEVDWRAGERHRRLSELKIENGQMRGK